MNDPPTHPLHWIEQNAQLKFEFQAAAKDIFDCDLTLDPVSGSLFFRVGKPDSPAPPIDRVAEGSYLNELLRLPTLETQGDGMQSALSLLMPVITSTFPLVLVDEPEAFLHPPQARKLGAILARLAHSRKVQMIVATHDRHFLTGLLDAAEVSVSVVRLSRDGDASQSKHLDSAKLRQAWGTASIRHSSLLDGLFHKLVVIAENERDCQFFAAALEALGSEEVLPLRPHDVLFVPSAGKGNIPALAEVLVASGVPVVAAPDLDILNSEGSIERLYTVLGGTWSTVKATYMAATAEFQVPRMTRTHRQVLDMVTGVLGTEPDATYTSQSKKDVAAAMGVESEWRRLKEYGVRAFRAEPVKAKELLDDLHARGIVPAHVGELERFAPMVVARKGDGWLEEAIACDAHRDKDVQHHLRQILAAGGFPTDD
ncbi:ATP-dependent nuclease [Paenarthrobacter sp. NPDC090520]|uniref:ATP-dependent nuclease n=1 Tax=Paenarthrobacter sp. NPDC090520 TaxID=3364382 RepID=UPI00380343B6